MHSIAILSETLFLIPKLFLLVETAVTIGIGILGLIPATALFGPMADLGTCIAFTLLCWTKISGMGRRIATK